MVDTKAKGDGRRLYDLLLHHLHLPGLTDVTAVVGAATTGFALKSDGTVRARGNGAVGWLGDGSRLPTG